MTHMWDRNQSIDTDLKMTEIMKAPDKGIRTAIINMLRILKKVEVNRSRVRDGEGEAHVELLHSKNTVDEMKKKKSGGLSNRLDAEKKMSEPEDIVTETTPHETP